MRTRSARKAAAVIRTLHAMGIEQTMMLTGDNAAVANAVGASLGLTRQFADTLPPTRREIIQEMQSRACVLPWSATGSTIYPH